VGGSEAYCSVAKFCSMLQHELVLQHVCRMLQLVLQHVVRCCKVERGTERSDSSFGPTLGDSHGLVPMCCTESPACARSWCSCGRGEPSLGAAVAGVSPVSVQMWQGGPFPGAEEAGAGPVSEQMWQG
jgi:hypothetical protein